MHPHTDFCFLASLRAALRARSALISPAMIAAALFASEGRANPDDGKVVRGQATITQSGRDTVRIDQRSDRAVINWNRFDIAPGETTRFVQPSANSVILNRVTGSQDPSQILGRLTSNGQIILSNRNGIVFGRDARIDVGALIATTHDIEDDAFMAGRMEFNISGSPDAAVTNLGSITAAERGLVALVAPSVRNDGTIVARLGKVALAAGSGFSVDMYGDDLIQLIVDEDHPAARHLIENTGRISADGGYVLLTASSAREVVDSVVNTSGIIEARSIGTVNGEVALIGGETGTVTVAGTIDVRGEDDGEIGGRAVITGETVTIANRAIVSADGHSGGGRVLIGGDYLGGNASGAAPHRAALPEPRPIRNAVTVDITEDVTISASATVAGDGGKLIVWSDENTQVDGNLLAQGSTVGSGGFIETSSKQNLGIGDGFVSAGSGGLWLLDPTDVVIANGIELTPLPDAIGSTLAFDQATITQATLNAALDTGTDVSIQASETITVSSNTSLFKSAPGSSKLTLDAGQTITFSGSASIDVDDTQGAALDVDLTAPNINFLAQTVNLNGGALSLTAHDGFGVAFAGSQADLNVGALSISSSANLQIVNNTTPNTVTPTLIRNVLQDGADVRLEVTREDGFIFVDDPLVKFSGPDASISFVVPRLLLRGGVASTSGKLDVNFEGTGDLSFLQADSGFANSLPGPGAVFTNGGDFSFSGTGIVINSSVLPASGALENPDLRSARVFTNGGDANLHFKVGASTPTQLNPGGFLNRVGCNLSSLCLNETTFSIDTGDGRIALTSDATTENISELPLLLLGDRALRTTGEIFVDGVNVTEASGSFTDATRTVRFNGPGNGVDAAVYGFLTLESGAFNVQDQTVTGMPPVDEPPSPILETVQLPNSVRGEAYSETTGVLFSDDQGVGNLTIEFAGLPSGLIAVANSDGTVTISGTPANSGAVSVVVTATDAGGSSVTTTLNFVVEEPVVEPADEPPVALVGGFVLPNSPLGESFEFSQAFPIFSDDGPISDLTLSVEGGPPGVVVILANDGRLLFSGTPTTEGAFVFRVRVTDASGGSATATFRFTVDSPVTPPPVDTPPIAFPGTVALPAAREGEAYNETTQVLFSDDRSIAELSLVVTGLPAGLIATPNDDGTVTISGTPTTSGALNFLVTATDAGNSTASIPVEITIDAATPPPPDDTGPVAFGGTVALPEAAVGTAYEETTIVLFSDDRPINELTLAINGLPTGLSATPNNDGSVTISGTPTASGSLNFTVTATDISGSSASIAVSIEVADAPIVEPVDTPPIAFPGTVFLPSAREGEAYTETTRVLFSDDRSVADLTLVVTGLPAGLIATPNVDGSVTISGTPSTSGSLNFLVTATDAANNTASIPINLTISEPTPEQPIDQPPVPVSETVTLPSANGGQTFNLTTQPLFADDQPLSQLRIVDGEDALSALGIDITLNNDGTISFSSNGVIDQPDRSFTQIFSVTVQDADGAQASVSFTIAFQGTVTPEQPDNPPVPRSAADVLPAGQEDAPYSERIGFFNDDGGIANLDVEIVSGLPEGLTATSPGSGLIDIVGTPTEAGEFTIVVRASDGTNTVERTSTISVQAARLNRPFSLNSNDDILLLPSRPTSLFRFRTEENFVQDEDPSDVRVEVQGLSMFSASVLSDGSVLITGNADLLPDNYPLVLLFDDEVSQESITATLIIDDPSFNERARFIDEATSADFAINFNFDLKNLGFSELEGYREEYTQLSNSTTYLDLAPLIGTAAIALPGALYTPVGAPLTLGSIERFLTKYAESKGTNIEEIRKLNSLRNVFQREVSEPPRNEAGWSLLPESKSIFHNIGYGEAQVEKWVSIYGDEAVFLISADGESRVINDGINNGTFNYEPDPNSPGHIILDILPWVLWGASDDDTLTPEQRLSIFLAKPFL